MVEKKELKTSFSLLEKRIQKLIYLHEQALHSNQELLSENRRLSLEIEEEKGKIQRLEEGYRNLKEVEKTGTKQTITQIKRRINDIIGELDKNMSLLELNK